MFHSKMLGRTALVLASGLAAAVAFFPSTASAAQESHSHTTQSAPQMMRTGGGPWCC